MEYIRKTMLTHTVIKNDDDRGSATHVVMSLDEYENLQQEIRALRKAVEQARKKQYNAEDKMRNGIAQIKKEAERKIAEERIALADELRQARVDQTHAEEQREQLLEIMKNRANAKRGIVPKKKHHGYIVIRSEEFDYSVSTGRSSRKTYHLWRTVIQTPVDIQITESEAAKIIHDAFINIFGGELGFDAFSKCDNLADSIKAISDTDWSNKTYLLDKKHRQNTRDCLWEVTYVHNRALRIPEAMYAKYKS